MDTVARIVEYVSSTPLGWTISIALVVIIGLFIHSYWIEAKKSRPSPAAITAKKQKCDIVNNSDDLEKLSGKLREYVNDYSNIEIQIANVKYLPLARALSLAFESAGWQTHLNSVPQENHPPRYIEGIAVMARNKSLLDVICKLFKEHGIPEIQPEYREIADKIASSKWHSVHNRIEIMIGHH